MNRKVLLTFLTTVVLSCNFLFPPAATNVPTAASSQVDSSPAVAPVGFTVVRLHPEDGDLQKLLTIETQKAMNLGQMPVVEFDATWCPPCKAIDAAIKSGDELMFAAYKGTYIIKLDVEEWEWNNGNVQNFAFDAIPVYFKLGGNGKQTGEVIDGGAWNEDIPENIAPVMDKFFHGD